MESFCDCGCGDHDTSSNHGIVSKKWLPDITVDGMSEIYVVDFLCLCLVPTGNNANEFRRVGVCI
jgi:hypothetical protein